MPSTPITDYRTEFSGITPQKLATVKTTLADVQSALLKLVSSDDILCGHSLDNDLRALKMVHLRVCDTAYLFPHGLGPNVKYSLKSLAKFHLRRDIQRPPPTTTVAVSTTAATATTNVTDTKDVKQNLNEPRSSNHMNLPATSAHASTTTISAATLTPAAADKAKPTADAFGHDSVEDACAALDLVMLKASRGFAFGGLPWPPSRMPECTALLPASVLPSSSDVVKRLLYQ
jgi:DNA polymerase III epsilon subunit-like protein